MKSNQDELYLYFSHPKETYAMPEVLEVLKALKKAFPGYKILDPEDVDVPEFLNCKDCMQNILKTYFFPLIEKCDVFAILAPIATCRIECELHYAWQLGKNVAYISYDAGEIDFEELNLREYHMMLIKEVMGVV
jgi:hypothetical protein